MTLLGYLLILHFVGLLIMLVALVATLWSGLELQFNIFPSHQLSRKWEKKIPRFFGISVLLIVLSGSLMMVDLTNKSKPIGWLIVPLISFIVLCFFGVYYGRRLSTTTLSRKNYGALFAPLLTIPLFIAILVMMSTKLCAFDATILLLAIVLVSWLTKYWLTHKAVSKK